MHTTVILAINMRAMIQLGMVLANLTNSTCHLQLIKCCCIGGICAPFYIHKAGYK